MISEPDVPGIFGHNLDALKSSDNWSTEFMPNPLWQIRGSSVSSEGISFSDLGFRRGAR
jgi:hypothetical protein